MSKTEIESVQDVGEEAKLDENNQTEKADEDHEKHKWIWKMSFDWDSNLMDKVCFGSGKSREYYPENPGHTRHGIAYAMNCHPGDVPNPSYVPSDDRLQKPTSLLGYGIGGLSARRFPTDEPLNNGDTAGKSKSKRKKNKKKKAEGVKEREKPSMQSMTSDGHIFSLKRSVFKEQEESQDIFMSTKTNRMSIMEEEKKLPKGIPPDKCKEIQRQKKIAFNTSTQSRTEKTDKLVGVGHYDISGPKNLCIKVPVADNFGSSPSFIKEMTKTICDYQGFDDCIECQRVLEYTDYYRSIRPISIPENYYMIYSSHGELNHPQNTPAFSARSKSVVRVTISSFQAAPVDLRRIQMSPKKHLALCRKCYCDLMNSGHGYWTKNQLVLEFAKCRHCINTHIHNNLPVTIHKVPCSFTHKLRRKEAVLNKYFPDTVDKVIRQAK